MNKARWTLVMAVAWIACKDLGAVREVSPDFRKQDKHWYPVYEGDYHIGWRLLPLDPAHLLHVKINEVRGRGEPGTIDQGVAQLWEALASRRLVAAGLSATKQLPQPIEDFMWEHLRFAVPKGSEREALATDGPHGPVAFREVTVKRDDLFREFGGPESNNSTGAERRTVPLNQLIATAYDDLWPNGPPLGLPIQRRDSMIETHLRTRYAYVGRPPHAVTFRRALRDKATNRQGDSR